MNNKLKIFLIYLFFFFVWMFLISFKYTQPFIFLPFVWIGGETFLNLYDNLWPLFFFLPPVLFTYFFSKKLKK